MERDGCHWSPSEAGGPGAPAKTQADDFIAVDPKGKFYTKAKMIADTQSPQNPSSTGHHLNRVKIRFYGNTAVAHRLRNPGATQR